MLTQNEGEHEVVGHIIHSQEAEKGELQCSAHFSLFMQSKIPARDMVPFTFRVSFPTPKKLFWKTHPDIYLLGNHKLSQLDNEG